MQLILALIPIIVVLVGIVGLKKPTWMVSIVAMLITLVIAIAAFGVEPMKHIPLFGRGVKSSAQTMVLVWGAFTLLEVMTRSKGMERVKFTIASFTTDRRLQLVLIAYCFDTFLEGVTGAGAPAALVAPFLVGLGFSPLTSAVAALIGNGVSPSTGGAGVPSIMGLAGITDTIPLNNAVAFTGRLHFIGELVLPFVLVIAIFGFKGIKKVWAYVLCIGVSMSVTKLLTTNLLGPEFGTLGPAVVGILVAICYIKFIGVKDDDPEYRGEKPKEAENMPTTGKAFAPYILLLILLPALRFTLPMQFMIWIGFATWIGLAIHLCNIIAAFIFGIQGQLLSCIGKALRRIIPAFVSMAALISMANFMNNSGMIRQIAVALSGAGALYPFLAVFIGSLGAFITGSNLSANVMFSPLQIETGILLHQNPVALVGANTAGGALGNLICPNNVIAVHTTVGLQNEEGNIMKRTFGAWIVMAVLYGLLSLLYTHILFPAAYWTW